MYFPATMNHPLVFLLFQNLPSAWDGRTWSAPLPGLQVNGLRSTGGDGAPPSHGMGMATDQKVNQWADESLDQMLALWLWMMIANESLISWSITRISDGKWMQMVIHDSDPWIIWLFRSWCMLTELHSEHRSLFMYVHINCFSIGTRTHVVFFLCLFDLTWDATYPWQASVLEESPIHWWVIVVRRGLDRIHHRHVLFVCVTDVFSKNWYVIHNQLSSAIRFLCNKILG